MILFGSNNDTQNLTTFADFCKTRYYQKKLQIHHFSNNTFFNSKDLIFYYTETIIFRYF